MNFSTRYSKQVAAMSILSGLLAMLCLALLGIAFADNPNAYDDPMQLLQMPSLNIAIVRWSMIADLFGYYLLLLPAIYFLRTYLREQTAWADLATYCGTAYVLVGSIGAVIMSEVVCPVLSQYFIAPADQQAHLRITYQTLNGIVYNGLWNVLETLLAGTWWTLTGFTICTWHKSLGWATVILGGSTLLDALGNLIGLPGLATIGLNIYLVLAPVWAIWLGVVIWKRAQPIPAVAMRYASIQA
ncbi:hypothetical protein GCM10028805_24520 [Spirosoma harenae]